MSFLSILTHLYAHQPDTFQPKPLREMMQNQKIEGAIIVKIYQL